MLVISSLKKPAIILISVLIGLVVLQAFGLIQWAVYDFVLCFIFGIICTILYFAINHWVSSAFWRACIMVILALVLTVLWAELSVGLFDFSWSGS